MTGQFVKTSCTTRLGVRVVVEEFSGGSRYTLFKYGMVIAIIDRVRSYLCSEAQWWQYLPERVDKLPRRKSVLAAIGWILLAIILVLASLSGMWVLLAIVPWTIMRVNSALHGSNGILFPEDLPTL